MKDYKNSIYSEEELEAESYRAEAPEEQCPCDECRHAPYADGEICTFHPCPFGLDD